MYGPSGCVDMLTAYLVSFTIRRAEALGYDNAAPAASFDEGHLCGLIQRTYAGFVTSAAGLSPAGGTHRVALPATVTARSADRSA
jgi:hypothetical protein